MRFDNGVQHLTVEFAPGYVRLKTSYPYSGEIYITRSTFLQVLRRSVPMANLWRRHPSSDFDVPQQVLEAYQQEVAFAQELRQEKKNRQIEMPDPAKARRQRQRYLRAKERARK
jgi:hypothetical protein